MNTKCSATRCGAPIASGRVAGGGSSGPILIAHRLALWRGARISAGLKSISCADRDAARYKNWTIDAPAVSCRLRYAAKPHAREPSLYFQLRAATAT